MQRLLALSALLALAAPVAPRAEGFITGSQLMQACTARSLDSERLCTGFIAGAADQVSANPALKGELCPLPVGVSLKDVKATVVKYGQEHADKVRQPGVLLLNEAVRERYPCK